LDWNWFTSFWFFWLLPRLYWFFFFVFDDLNWPLFFSTDIESIDERQCATFD
jgi:hypothetical protein